jgi:hypothetical protein
VVHRLGALPAEELEALLAVRRKELKQADRALAARLAEGAVGRALTIDLGVYLASRQDALVLLRTALREPDYSQLFHATESYRAGADGQEKTINLLRALGSLIEDLLLVVAGTPRLVRNLDLASELARPAPWRRWSRACGATCCARSRWTRWRSVWNGPRRETRQASCPRKNISSNLRFASGIFTITSNLTTNESLPLQWPLPAIRSGHTSSVDPAGFASLGASGPTAFIEKRRAANLAFFPRQESPAGVLVSLSFPLEGCLL